MLATLSELKSYLNITDTDSDTLLTMLLSSADSSIKTRTGRELELDGANRVEVMDGRGQPNLFLEKYPVATFVSLEKNTGTIPVPVWEVIPTTSYAVRNATGIISFTGSEYRGINRLRATYTAGYATIPGDLKLACIKIAASAYNRRNSDGIKSETVNGDRLDFDASELPKDVEDIIDNYRRPYV